MAGIVLTTADGSQGQITSADGRTFIGPIPPNDSEVASIYAALLTAGVKPTPYTAPAPATVTVTGNQWAFALGDLGLADAWRGAVARSKGKDQNRIGLIARDTPLVVTDPLLIRVAGNAGMDASGKPIIDVPTVFTKAQTEPT